MFKPIFGIIALVVGLSLSTQAQNQSWLEGVSGLRHLAVTSLVEHLSIYIVNDQGQSYWAEVPSKIATATQVVVDAELLLAQIKFGLQKVKASQNKTEIFILHTHPKESIRSIYQRSHSSNKSQSWALTLPPSRTDLDFIFSMNQHLQNLDYYERYQITQVSGVVVDPVGLYFFRTFLNVSEREQNLTRLGIVYEEPPADLEAEMSYNRAINKTFNAAVDEWIGFNKSHNPDSDSSALAHHHFQKLQATYANYTIGFLLEYETF